MIPETCSVVEDESLTERNLQVFISPRIKLIEMKSGITLNESKTFRFSVKLISNSFRNLIDIK